jgi:hypothetical protein
MGRGLPSDLLEYEVDRYKQKLFLFACQLIETEEQERERS